YGQGLVLHLGEAIIVIGWRAVRVGGGRWCVARSRQRARCRSASGQIFGTLDLDLVVLREQRHERVVIVVVPHRLTPYQVQPVIYWQCPCARMPKAARKVIFKARASV